MIRHALALCALLVGATAVAAQEPSPPELPALVPTPPELPPPSTSWSTTTVTRAGNSTIYKVTTSDGVTTTTTVTRDGNRTTTTVDRSDAIYDPTGRGFRQ
jgi:hypothetical protein